MVIVKQKTSRPFTWYITDHPNIKGQTIRMELEYAVIDRLFHCTAHKRGNPRDHFGKGRPATPEEMGIAKAAIGEKELARCMAESINPSIWTRARWSARVRREERLLQNATITFPDGTVHRLGPMTVSMVNPQS